MTKQEKLIVTAYTGVMMVEQDEFYDYLEELLGRPILAKEINTDAFAEEVIAAAKDDFMRLCEE